MEPVVQKRLAVARLAGGMAQRVLPPSEGTGPAEPGFQSHSRDGENMKNANGAVLDLAPVKPCARDVVTALNEAGRAGPPLARNRASNEVRLRNTLRHHGGEGGIRTHGPLLGETRSPGVPNQPLWHLSATSRPFRKLEFSAAR